MNNNKIYLSMGLFSDIWELIKEAGKGIFNFFVKIFTFVYNKVKFTVECILKLIPLLKNHWIGKLITGIKLIYDLVQFFKSKGADVDESYKSKIQDMDINNHGNHQINIEVSP